MANFLIYGANGYTGDLIARRAQASGLRPILAGRNQDAVQKLGRELDLEHHDRVRAIQQLRLTGDVTGLQRRRRDESGGPARGHEQRGDGQGDDACRSAYTGVGQRAGAGEAGRHGGETFAGRVRREWRGVTDAVQWSGRDGGGEASPA